MKAALEAIVAGLKAFAGAKAVILADPRYPFALPPSDSLPAVILTPLSGAALGVIPGHPHQIMSVPNPLYPGEEPWPRNAYVIYRHDDQVLMQVDVYGDPNVAVGNAGATDSVAMLAVAWLEGIGRDALRRVRSRVTGITSPRRMVDLLAEVTSTSLDRWVFEFTLIVPRAYGVVTETVEEVTMNGEIEGAVNPQRNIVVKTT